jgi:hypothetical protein
MLSYKSFMLTYWLLNNLNLVKVTFSSTIFQKFFYLTFFLLFQTLIEANVAVKTTDGYLLRLFCIGFTKKAPNQVKKTSYAKSSQVRLIRAKMVEIIQREVF